MVETQEIEPVWGDLNLEEGFDNWDSARKESRCCVYSVFTAENRLAYVGIADDFERRWRQHRSKSWWLKEIQIDRVLVMWYPSRSLARWVEASVINQAHPIYNTSLESPTYRDAVRRFGEYGPISDYTCTDIYCPVKEVS